MEPVEGALLACADTLGDGEADAFDVVAAAVLPGEATAAAVDFDEAANPEPLGAGAEGDGAIEGEGDMEQQL